MKKGDKGGFEFNFSAGHRLDFLNELLRRHMVSSRLLPLAVVWRLVVVLVITVAIHIHAVQHGS